MKVAAWLVFALIIYLVAVQSANVAGLGSPRPATYRDSGHDAGMACVMAEGFIKDQLKAPSTAEFDYAHCRDHATHAGDTWTLRSYVDADNSFGAHIRTFYVAKLMNIPPSATWRLLELQFDEP